MGEGVGVMTAISLALIRVYRVTLGPIFGLVSGCRYTPTCSQYGYEAIQRYAAAGGAVLLYSSELSEIVQLCDRCLVIYEGRIVAQLEGNQIEERRIVAAATGHVEKSHVRSAA